MARASDNPYPSALFVEGSAPTSPASGDQRIFIDVADHKLKRVNSSGTVTTIESAGGSFPAGELGYTQITTASLSTASGSLVDLTGVTVTVTIGSRPVVVSAFVPQWSHSATTNQRALFALIDSTASAQIQDIVVSAGSGGNANGFFIAVRVNPSAGSRTYKVQYKAVDAGTITVNGGSTAPIYIQVVEV